MPHNLTVSGQLTHSTVRIECDTPDGRGTGTGFFFRCLDDGKQYVPVIVTNKHVVAGATTGRFHLTLSEQGGPKIGSHIQIKIPDFEQRWISHPDPSVDLCVMPVHPLVQEASRAGHKFFYIALDKSSIPTTTELSDFGALEDIVMIGYPRGIWDASNNMPIIRRGVTATHPNLNYGGRHEFMIDAACFPGSSGSPIFLYNDRGWTTRTGDTVVGATRVKLLGLLYAGPEYTATGEVQVVTVPTQQRTIAKSNIPMNLGFVIKSSRILEMDKVLSSIV